jgi:hypothetical protein
LHKKKHRLFGTRKTKFGARLTTNDIPSIDNSFEAKPLKNNNGNNSNIEKRDNGIINELKQRGYDGVDKKKTALFPSTMSVNILIIDYSHNWATTIKKNETTKDGKKIIIHQSNLKDSCFL